MSGPSFLLDTNFIIGLTKAHEPVLEQVAQKQVDVSDCAYSFITRIELLSFGSLGSEEERIIETLLDAMTYVPMTTAIENRTILIRRQLGLKLPDAIIGATALELGVSLLTLDQKLASRIQSLLS